MKTPNSLFRLLSLACTAALFATTALAATRQVASPEPVEIRGSLDQIAGQAPRLDLAGKQYTLAGQSTYLLHVLEDKRLKGQQLQLTGEAGPGGTFVVSRIYVVRSGKLYKIQYYCQVCNIIYVQPGHCYCCGRETELQEVPVR